MEYPYGASSKLKDRLSVYGLLAAHVPSLRRHRIINGRRYENKNEINVYYTDLWTFFFLIRKTRVA